MDGKAVRVRQDSVKEVVIEGVVQGVGYRQFVRDCALRHFVSGWVRNRSDGAVQALLQGDAANIDALLAKMRRGPPGSKVVRVGVSECEGNEAEKIGGFTIRPTC